MPSAPSACRDNETNRNAGELVVVWSNSRPAKREPRSTCASPAIVRSWNGSWRSGRIISVSAGAKVLVAPLAGSYERDVIRPHVLGRFEDMVLASARHPAMLAYLDNFQSIGPSSQGAQAGQRNNGARRGLNENYARELLELHTLGVNGGYAGGRSGARAFSPGGQSQESRVRVHGNRVPACGAAAVRRVRPEAGGPLGFAFQELLHEPGAKTVLKQRYKEDGVAEGERAIRACAGIRPRHDSSQPNSQPISSATILRPQPSIVWRAPSARARAISKAVANALIDEPDAWRDDTRKFRAAGLVRCRPTRIRIDRGEPERTGGAATTAATTLVASFSEGLR